MNMTSVEKTIRVLERQCEAFEADITALQARRDETFSLITGLRRAAGAPEPASVKRKAIKAATRPVATRPAPKAKKNGQPTVMTQRSNQLRDQILEAVRAFGKPVSPGTVATKMGIATVTVRKHIRTLAQAGAVVVSGATLDRRVSIAGAKSAQTEAAQAPAPQPRPSTPHTSRAGMTSPAPADVVKARDAAIERRLGQGPATMAQLLIAMPHEPELDEAQRKKACENAIVRLRTKGIITHSDAGGYRLAQ